jgi:UDP-N-acetylmuramoyl-L-alanyl-D-glutamate--2,6-diaminopimelate ligase
MVRKIKNYYHLGEAITSNLFYRFPGKKSTVIGVTGTDGKTTTASILSSILTDAGYKTALITTIGAYINGKFYDTGFHTTTPSSRVLQKYIKKAVSENCKYIIIEITSHALDQNRVWGIPIKIGIVTNITNEHLDYHKTYEHYLKAKSKLLKMSKIPIINRDDKSYSILKKMLAYRNIVEYSLTNGELLPGKMNLIGEFNMQNALAAATAAKQLGVDEEIIKKSISGFEAPEGRQAVVHEDSFKVIVDFAHTPNAFEQVLPVVKKETKGKLIHVFGAAGKRDPYKRPHMGNASSKYSDIIILTAEDPRGENIKKINLHIMAGFQRDVEAFEVTDRLEAIKRAIGLAKKGDTVLITGKGHERSMNIDGKHEIPWNDKEAVNEILTEKQP